MLVSRIRPSGPSASLDWNYFTLLTIVENIDQLKYSINTNPNNYISRKNARPIKYWNILTSKIT